MSSETVRQQDTASDKPLWTPSPAEIGSLQLETFRKRFETALGRTLPSYADLHRASLEEREAFWSLVWDCGGIIGEKGGAVLGRDTMPGAEFFPQARLNFAENLLRRCDDGEAMVFRSEDKIERRVSWRELTELVSRMQQWLRANGVGVGDRVAAMMPNCPETVAAMLAATGLGAIWSSCSPDFGVGGVVDRFGQIEPKVLIACDGYWYAGKRIDVSEKLRDIAGRIPSAKAVLVVPFLGEAKPVAASIPGGVAMDDALAPHAPGALVFERLPFDHPLYILFSSGTTGIPKCIVHGAGGTLVQHIKELKLHCDIRRDDRVFYFTTCGWMMWNWLVSALACEATLILFDGSPFHPTPAVLWDCAVAEKVTLFGTSAKYLDSCRKAGLAPALTHDLSSVRLLTSTGSPLAPESFDYVYEAIKPDVHLASMSGGTDICGCFVMGDPTSPVWRSEIQAPALAMAVEVWDDEGRPVRREKGELVCVKAFPSMPVRFWNDPEGTKYRAAYFDRFHGVWCHGDFAEVTAHGGFIIYGRSDATLNPGGVRIGTAEIYSQVERIETVMEALAIGQNWDNDVRVVLFVRLREGVVLDAALEKQIRDVIRAGASPRHVPARIVAVADIPRTKSGKITELAVRDIVHGREVKNREALANPEALELYRDLPALQN